VAVSLGIELGTNLRTDLARKEISTRVAVSSDATLVIRPKHY
jgi:hypothetical protein